MQLIKSIFLAGIFLFFGQQVFAQSDYVTIVAENKKPKEVFISINDEKYIRKDIDNAQGKWWNYTGVLKEVRKYEAKGYEVKNSNITYSGASPYAYFILIREEN